MTETGNRSPRENVSNLLPLWCKPYIALAAAKLGIQKSQVMANALGMHRDYLIRSGVLKPEETE